MAVNKNFVVKNGLEVFTSLILADTVSEKVGIGSTNPRVKLDVRGGIAATDIAVSGIGTFNDRLFVGVAGTILYATGIGGSVGVGTNLPGFLLDVRGPVASGQTALNVYGDANISGTLNGQVINFTGGASFANLLVPGITTSTRLNVTGFGTITALFVPAEATIGVGIITNIRNTNFRNTGISTLATSGYVLIGTGSSTRTANQRLQVGSATTPYGAYVSGLVGIGTTNPQVRTEIRDGTTEQLRVGSNISGHVYVGFDTAQRLGRIGAYNGAFQDLYLNEGGGNITLGSSINSGRVGIATTNPTSRLTVTGDALVTGVGTINNIQIGAGVITSRSGVVTFYGDGSGLYGISPNLTAAIGITSANNQVGYGITLFNIVGGGATFTATGSAATMTLPPAGISIGLAIALGG